MPIRAGAEVRLSGIRTRAEVSRFQFYYQDADTNNQWSVLGPPQEVPQDHGDGYIPLSPVKGGAIPPKTADWQIGIDNAIISYGGNWGAADVRVELPGVATEGFFHLFDGPDENTAVRVALIL
jgi:hypothetical protein